MHRSIPEDGHGVGTLEWSVLKYDNVNYDGYGVDPNHGAIAGSLILNSKDKFDVAGVRGQEIANHGTVYLKIKKDL